jgi:hypothetical protein
MIVFFVFMNCNLFLEFVGEDVEETVADLRLGNQRGNVIDFEFSASELIIHLFNVLL